MNEVPDVLRGYAVLSAHVHLAGPVGDGAANVHNLILGQLCVAVVFASSLTSAESGFRWIAVAALAGAVGIVVSDSAEKQVIRIAARRVIATMANALAGRNIALYQCVRDSMGRVCSFANDSKDAVTATVFAPSPWPALAGFSDCDLAPKTRQQPFVNHEFIVTRRM